jgi:hypothetical protein
VLEQELLCLLAHGSKVVLCRQEARSESEVGVERCHQKGGRFTVCRVSGSKSGEQSGVGQDRGEVCGRLRWKRVW